jgi:hypothetical protein
MTRGFDPFIFYLYLFASAAFVFTPFLHSIALSLGMNIDLVPRLTTITLQFSFPASVNTHANMDTLPRSDTASYTSMNSPTPSSAATSGGAGGGSGASNFDIDFNESILQVHKRSPLYIIGDRAQHRVSRANTLQMFSFKHTLRITISDWPSRAISKLLFSSAGISRCQPDQSQFQKDDTRLRSEHVIANNKQSYQS